MKQRQGFTLIELLVVISIIALLVGILLPALGAARRSAMQMKSNTQMRGMHQGMVIFAQNNKGFYPGIEAGGARWTTPPDNLALKFGYSVQARFAILVEEGYFTPEFAIHPAEPNRNIEHEPYKLGSGDRFDVNHYSYAMLSINVNNASTSQINLNETKHRRSEWRDTVNAEAIILSDRLVEVVGNAFNDPDAYRGVWTEKAGDAKWGVVWNDNHTTFENTPFFPTRYGDISNSNDDLYSRSRTSSGNIQTPQATGVNNDGNAIMVSDEAIGLIQKVGP